MKYAKQFLQLINNCRGGGGGGGGSGGGGGGGSETECYWTFVRAKKLSWSTLLCDNRGAVEVSGVVVVTFCQKTDDTSRIS